MTRACQAARPHRPSLKSCPDAVFLTPLTSPQKLGDILGTSGDRNELLGEALDGRYRLDKRIGLGGSGVVFEATPLAQSAAPVAVKMLRDCFAAHTDLARRLRREAEVARSVGHPGIVPVLDEGTLFDGSPYFVMPRLYGETLARLLMRTRLLPVEQVAMIAIRVASILHSAHCAGYTHRDVKPEHILLNRSRAGDLVVYLMDFGVCATADAGADERKLEQGKVFGTPSYASPEQAAGSPDVDGRADLFSLGVVMYEALTGQLPFRGTSVATLLLRIIREDAPRVRDSVPRIDAEMDAIVATLLAREPDRRLPSARALGRALMPHADNRRRIEREIARRLNVTSHSTDHAPTARNDQARAAVG